MPFELRDHTADVAVAATGDTLEEVFAAVADGLAAATCEEIPGPDDRGTHGNDGGDNDTGGTDDCNGGDRDGDDGDDEDLTRFSLSVAAESREALLYDYLADLIYERDVRSVLPVDNEVTIREPTTEQRTDTPDPERTESERTGSESTADESTDDGPADDGPANDEPTAEGSTADESSADAWHLDATAQGVALSAIDAREVKAVTYSEMALEETSDGWGAYVVFDV